MLGEWPWEVIVFHAGYILPGVGAICFYKATAFHFCKQGCTGVFTLAWAVLILRHGYVCDIAVVSYNASFGSL